MDPTTHGTARLGRFSIISLTPNISAEKVTNTFPLSTNGAPFETPPSYKPLDEQWIGEPIELNGQRLENPDYGTGWSPSVFPGMAITFGYAGSGKGGLLIPAALTYGGSMVLNDPKGELMWITGARRKSFSKVANCDPFGEVQKGYADKVNTIEPVMRYNPLAALFPDSYDFAERVATIAEALAIDIGRENNFFSGTGRDLIEGVIAAEATANPGKATLRMVRKWLTLSPSEFAGTVKSFVEHFPAGLATSKLRGFTDMESRTNQSTLITAKEQTKFLDNEAIAWYFEPAEGEETFSFDELATGRLTVYIVLPGRLLGSYSGFSRLMFNQALEAVQRVRKENLKHPVTFLIDEAGTAIGRLDSVEQAYGLARGAGMVLWSFYQDLAQLQRDYPKSWETFISNSACVTVTGARDKATCDYFSSYLGSKTIAVGGTSVNTGHGPGGASSGTSENKSSTGRPVLYPEEIRTMDMRDLLVLMPSSIGNYMQSKLVYYKDARFNGMYRPDPKYGETSPAPPYPRGPYALPPLSSPPKDGKGLGIGTRFLIVLGVLFFSAFLLGGTMKMPYVGAVLFFGTVVWAIFAGKSGPKDRRGQWFIKRTKAGDGNVGSIAGWPETRSSESASGKPEGSLPPSGLR